MSTPVGTPVASTGGQSKMMVIGVSITVFIILAAIVYYFMSQGGGSSAPGDSGAFKAASFGNKTGTASGTFDTTEPFIDTPAPPSNGNGNGDTGTNTGTGTAPTIPTSDTGTVPGNTGVTTGTIPPPDTAACRKFAGPSQGELCDNKVYTLKLAAGSLGIGGVNKNEVEINIAEPLRIVHGPTGFVEFRLASDNKKRLALKRKAVNTQPTIVVPPGLLGAVPDPTANDLKPISGDPAVECSMTVVDVIENDSTLSTYEYLFSPQKQLNGKWKFVAKESQFTLASRPEEVTHRRGWKECRMDQKCHANNECDGVKGWQGTDPNVTWHNSHHQEGASCFLPWEWKYQCCTFSPPYVYLLNPKAMTDAQTDGEWELAVVDNYVPPVVIPDFGNIDFGTSKWLAIPKIDCNLQ